MCRRPSKVRLPLNLDALRCCNTSEPTATDVPSCFAKSSQFEQQNPLAREGLAASEGREQRERFRLPACSSQQPGRTVRLQTAAPAAGDVEQVGSCGGAVARSAAVRPAAPLRTAVQPTLWLDGVRATIRRLFRSRGSCPLLSFPAAVATHRDGTALTPTGSGSCSAEPTPLLFVAGQQRAGGVRGGAVRHSAESDGHSTRSEHSTGTDRLVLGSGRSVRPRSVPTSPTGRLRRHCHHCRFRPAARCKGCSTGKSQLGPTGWRRPSPVRTVPLPADRLRKREPFQRRASRQRTADCPGALVAGTVELHAVAAGAALSSTRPLDAAPVAPSARPRPADRSGRPERPFCHDDGGVDARWPNRQPVARRQAAGRAALGEVPPSTGRPAATRPGADGRAGRRDQCGPPGWANSVANPGSATSAGHKQRPSSSVRNRPVKAGPLEGRTVQERLG